MKQTSSSKQKWSAFETLRFRVAQAHWEWKVWRQLFVADPSRPEDSADWPGIMDSVGPAFFSMLHDVLLQDVVLRICKLFDPPKGGPATAKRDSLSLAAARERAKAHLPTATVVQIRKDTFALQRAAKPLEAWRNRRLAHDDERTAIGVDSLPPLPLSRIEDCLARAVSIMVKLDPESASTSYAYDDMIAHGDGESIKYAVRCSKEYNKVCLVARCRPLSKEARDKFSIQ